MRVSFGAVLMLFSLLVLGTLLSYWFSLDRDFNHSRETASLPLFNGSTESGLVQIEANGYLFRARVAGFSPDSETKPAVILLHGFPSTSITWIDLIPVLESKGYRVLAFDQRGYSPGARPEGIEEYTGRKRISDIMSIANALNIEKFHLIGHDWGSVIGWLTVAKYPERILSWAGLSGPHPAALVEGFERNWEQQLKSWYIRAYQLPWLAEIMYGAFNADALWLGYGHYPEHKVREHHKVFSEPGAMTAALNWYRAISLSSQDSTLVPDPHVRVPTLFIWGTNDFSVSRWTVLKQADYIQAPYRLLELDAGHWVLNDKPKIVIDAILQHLAGR